MADIDTGSLIMRVQEHPVLWDVSHKDYKDREARHAAWMDICGELFPNFTNFNEQHKQTTCIKVQSRWKTARDMYNKVNLYKKKCKKQIKSGAGGKGKKMKYIYYDIMTFLDSNTSNRCDERKSVDALKCPDDKSEVDSEDEPLCRGNREVASSSKRKRPSSPTPFEKQLLEAVTRKTNDDDEDVSFFKSIMPNIKKFNSYQKLLFRAKVLEYLIQVEKEKVVTLVELSDIKTENT